MRRLLVLLSFAAMPATAQLPPPVRDRPAGQLAVATSPALAPLVRRAAADYHKLHPDITITVSAPGSDVAMAALAVDHADLAIIGRDATESELKAVEWIYLKPPLAIPVGRGPLLRVVVARANPLTSITMTQLVALLRPSASMIRWRDLGVTGALATESVRLVLPDLDSGTGRFLRHVLLADATQAAWERIQEADPNGRGGLTGSSIIRRVAVSTTSLGITDAALTTAVRVVPVTGAPQALRRTVVAYVKAGQDAAKSFATFMAARSSAAHRSSIDPTFH